VAEEQAKTSVVDIDKLISDHAKSQYRAIANQLESVSNFILEDFPVPRLRETIFVSYFLPFFCAEKSIEEDKRALLAWYNVSGGPMGEVDIVDEADKVLFRVPQLMDTSIIKSQRTPENRVSIGAITTGAMQANNNIPGSGTRLLLRNLSVKSAEILKTSDKKEIDAERWNQIFVRYGKIKKAQESKVAGSTPGAFTDDELDF
jgi:hypothetical protein